MLNKRHSTNEKVKMNVKVRGLESKKVLIEKNYEMMKKSVGSKRKTTKAISQSKKWMFGLGKEEKMIEMRIIMALVCNKTNVFFALLLSKNNLLFHLFSVLVSKAISSHTINFLI